MLSVSAALSALMLPEFSHIIRPAHAHRGVVRTATSAAFYQCFLFNHHSIGTAQSCRNPDLSIPFNTSILDLACGSITLGNKQSHKGTLPSELMKPGKSGQPANDARPMVTSSRRVVCLCIATMNRATQACPSLFTSTTITSTRIKLVCTQISQSSP